MAAGIFAAALLITVGLRAERVGGGATRDAIIAVEPSPTSTFTAVEGEVVKAKYSIVNVSNQPIRLLGVNTSCGCTVASTEFPISLEVGGRTSVQIDMTVGTPGPDNIFEQDATLLVNAEGVVPLLTTRAEVVPSRKEQ